MEITGAQRWCFPHNRSHSYHGGGSAGAVPNGPADRRPVGLSARRPITSVQPVDNMATMDAR
jgi:hypothetical protein